MRASRRVWGAVVTTTATATTTTTTANVAPIDGAVAALSRAPSAFRYPAVTVEVRAEGGTSSSLALHVARATHTPLAVMRTSPFGLALPDPPVKFILAVDSAKDEVVGYRVNDEQRVGVARLSIDYAEIWREKVQRGHFDACAPLIQAVRRAWVRHQVRETVPTIVDGTAGLSIDAFLLAHHGYRVRMWERDRVLVVLIAHAMDRVMRQGDEPHFLFDTINRMSLMNDDTKVLLPTVDEQFVLYLDPFYPTTSKSTKSANAKLITFARDLAQWRQPFESSTSDTHQTIDSEGELVELIMAAQANPRCVGVVVKRPLSAPAIRVPGSSIMTCVKSRDTAYWLVDWQRIDRNVSGITTETVAGLHHDSARRPSDRVLTSRDRDTARGR